jgi:hypothetical protein
VQSLNAIQFTDFPEAAGQLTVASHRPGAHSSASGADGAVLCKGCFVVERVKLKKV